MKLHGVFPPLTTPFEADGSLAPQRMKENVARYNRAGVAGYVATGSTGEAVLLSGDELERTWAAVAEAAAPGRILIAGTGTDSTAETIARTNRAAALGFHVALVKTPYYFKPQMTPEALAEHFLRVADAARMPVLVYSVPQFTGVGVDAPLVARLSGHPNIIGIKESSGNIQLAAQIVLATPPEFQTLVGSGTTFFAALGMGAVGGILAIADIFPEMCVELYEAARAGAMAQARALQQALVAPTACIVGKLGVPGVKYAMDRLGCYGGPARAPFLPLTEAQKNEIEAELARAMKAVPAGA
jgi:4-hydroxy-2-oxoglutarate aldolase